jgi:hypothetical protein
MRELPTVLTHQTNRRAVAPRESAADSPPRPARGMRPDPALILGLQRTMGNQRVQRLLGRNAAPAGLPGTTSVAAAPPSRASGAVVQRSAGLHIIAEIPLLLVKLITGAKDDWPRAETESVRRFGDAARRTALANFVSNRIAEYADQEAADTIAYSDVQVARIKDLLEQLHRLGHEADNPQYGNRVIKIGGGYFAKVNAGSWDEYEGRYEFLLGQLVTEVKSGEALNTQGPSLPAQGPIEVDRAMVARMFFGTEDFVLNHVNVRGHPQSTMGDDEE